MSDAFVGRGTVEHGPLQVDDLEHQVRGYLGKFDL